MTTTNNIDSSSTSTKLTKGCNNDTNTKNENNYLSTVKEIDDDVTPQIIDTVNDIRTSMQLLHDSTINQSFEWRIQQLNIMEQMLCEKNDEFVIAIQSDLHCCDIEAICCQIQMILVEIKAVRKHIREYCSKSQHRIPSPAVCFPSYSYVQPMPLLGPAVLIIGPSNYPLALALQPAVGALAAGNPVLIKPSEHCLATSSILEKYIHEYFTNNAVRVIQGGINITSHLLEHRWGKIFFTGSQTVGKLIASAASKTLTPLALELGGKTPCIIDPEIKSKDMDLTLIANRILWSKFINGGQTCAAVDTVLMTNDMLNALLPLLITSLYKQFGPTDDNILSYNASHMTRIVNIRNTQRLYNIIQQVEEKINHTGTEKTNNGAVTNNHTNNSNNNTQRNDDGDCKIVFGGTKHCNVNNKFIAPTIIINPPNDCTIVQEEIFGPILLIITKGLNDRIDFINYVRNNIPGTPLCMYVFTKSNTTFQEYTKQIRAGSIMRNDCMVHLSSPYIPFGGLGTSGYGIYHGKYSIETFTHLLPVMYRPTWSGSDFNMIRYHPFIPGTIKYWIDKNLITQLPAIPVLYLPEITIGTILIGIIVGVVLYFYL